MIGYLRGKVTYIFSDACFLEVNGIGWRVFVPEMTLRSLHVGDEVMLFTHLNVREDAMLLYGFAAREDYEIFQLLITVSGIGPKVAMGILSSITVPKLCQAIQGKQLTVLTKLPGIGKKSAERLILELKDKLTLSSSEITEDDIEMEIPDDLQSEASAALASLGYTTSEIGPVLRKAGTLKSVEEIIKFALKEFAGR